jgi:predicted enzyme related to lactoylglutathione lyase
MGDKQRWIELKIPGAETNIVLFTPEGHEAMIGKFSNIVFACTNVEKTYQELREKGVEFVQPPSKETWGGMALFKDIDGNVFCLGSR